MLISTHHRAPSTFWTALFDAVSPYDLTHHYYDNKPPSREHDCLQVNRRRRYEAAGFINRFCRDHGLNKAGALRAEELLHLAPSSLNGREDLTQWIAAHWNDAPAHTMAGLLAPGRNPNWFR